MRYSILSRYRPELMGFAMLWVLLFHTQGLKIGFWPLKLLRGVGFGGVDIFILLSGLGLTMSLCRREQSYGAFLARRGKRLLPAYFLVMVPYTLFLIARGEAEVSTLFWNAALLSYWVGAPGAFNWYISGVALFYLLTPGWVRLLRRSRRPAALTAAAVAVSLAAVQLLLRCNFWAWGDVLYRFPLFFLSLLVGLYAWEDRPVSRRSAVLWALSLAAAGGYGLYILLAGAGAAFCPWPYVFLFAAVPLCLLLCWCFDRLPPAGLRSLLRRVGESSLEIYLLNVSLFAAAAPAAQEWLLPLDLPGGMALYYLVTIPLNIALGMLFHRALAAGLKRLETAHTK